MALEKLKRGCPYGKEIAEEIEKGGNAGIETRLAALETMSIETRLAALETMSIETRLAALETMSIETRLAALETMFAAVLAAEDTDNGKTLQIDSNGKVALVTV
jgi:purine-nucleoside phosphorylase